MRDVSVQGVPLGDIANFIVVNQRQPHSASRDLIAPHIEPSHFTVLQITQKVLMTLTKDASAQTATCSSCLVCEELNASLRFVFVPVYTSMILMNKY